MKELELPKWDELFEDLWQKYAQHFTSQGNNLSNLGLISYSDAKEIALRVMQNALVPKVREIIRLNPNRIHIPADAYFKLKETGRYLPSDDPSARCLGLMDSNTGVVWYTYIEEFPDPEIGPSILNLAALHLVKE